MIRPTPKPTRTDTLFPDTTLFRSPVFGKTPNFPSIPLAEPHDRVHRQFAIEVGEQGVAACFFPSDGVAERGEVDFGDTQVALASEMPGERAVELVGGRQVDIAVGDIDRRAAKDRKSTRLNSSH